MEQEYNGWTNRETWATALWINNEQGFYYYAQDLIQEAKECQDNDALNCLTDALEQWIGELLDMEMVLSAPPANRKELINMSKDIGSLYRVNWKEIAESFLSEMEVNA